MANDIPHPMVIAHRGASGYLPEHTPEAKILAHWQGADYLEQDVVATRDGTLIVFHDIYLDSVTDVAELYTERHREDGHYYAVDFDASEIRELTVSDRSNQETTEAIYPQGFPSLTERFKISTLREEIDLIQELNRVTGRDVGIYPELKHPAWHRQHGIDLAADVLETLAATGYETADDPVFVQCFDPAEIRRLKEEFATTLRLIQLVSTSQEYATVLTPDGLSELTEFAHGIAPGYGQLAAVKDGEIVTPSTLFESARDTGLELHPYTFRRRDLPPYADSLEALLEVFFRRIPVDGVFCDYPDVAVRVRASL